MAHPEAEAVEQSTESGSTLDDILKLAGEEPDTPQEEEEPEAETDEGGEPEAEDAEEVLEDEDEAEEPLEVIKPPVSFNKEMQAKFSALAETDPELAKAFADHELQRNEQVRLKTTEASEATRNATAVAQAQLAAIQQQYATELEVYAKAFMPVKPDLALLANDPASYAQQAAIYEEMAAQHDSLMQQVFQVRGQAQEFQVQASQQDIAAEQALLKAQWPEILDPAKQAELWTGLVETGGELGFTQENLGNSSASEMLALKKAGEWRAKAAKWDAFQSSKMAKIRAAKDLPKVATPGTGSRVNQSKADKATAAFNRAKVSRSANDYVDFFEASGVSL
ncbi:MAG: hypothetical protein IPN56_14355 [Chitinophagaceae bacterium]|nr:hypothetical protein [Chitinophagaceae bacterium]MBK9661490.1 hypothetical protein [Chitinophagaceae bacterium]